MMMIFSRDSQDM